MPKNTIRLLIAEDEDAIRNGIEKHIREKTQIIDEIYTAENGQVALDSILRYRPQIMLLDIQMPLKDGLTVMQEARAADACPRTVILSGHDQFSYAQKAIQYGVVDYLLKPCRAAEILKRMEDLARQVLEADGQAVPPPAAAGEEAGAGNRLVSRAIEHMENHFPEPLTLGAVADEIGISPNYLSTLFTRTLGSSFVDTLNKIRIERACDYFSDEKAKTYEVAYKVGFRDEKYFSSVFKKLMGQSPSEYKKKRGGP